jgi:hypothetical protein
MKPKPQSSLMTICAASVRMACLVRERTSYGSWTRATAMPYDLRIVSQVPSVECERRVLTAS